MPKYVLHYFDIDARAELIRLILAYGNIDHEEVRIKIEDWPEMKPKYPYTTIPVLEIDGQVVAQNGAITRYLARVAGIDGKTGHQKFLADMYNDSFTIDIIDQTYRFRVPMIEPDEEKRKEKAQKFLEEKLSPFFDQLEETYKKNGGGPWFCGETFTYADLACFRMVSNLKNLIMQMETPHPCIHDNFERTSNIPRVQEHMKNRPQRPF